MLREWGYTEAYTGGETIESLCVAETIRETGPVGK